MIDINKVYLADIVRVTDIDYKTIIHPYIDTQTTHYVEYVGSGIIYEYESNRFKDLKSRNTYSSNVSTSAIGDIVINPRRMVPITILLDKCEISYKQREFKRTIVNKVDFANEIYRSNKTKEDKPKVKTLKRSD